MGRRLCADARQSDSACSCHITVSTSVRSNSVPLCPTSFSPLLVGLVPFLILFHLLRGSRFAFVYGDAFGTLFWSVAALIVFLAVSLLRLKLRRSEAPCQSEHAR